MRVALALAVSVFFMIGQVWADDDSALKTKKEKESYAVGFSMGKSLQQQAIDVNTDILFRGIKDVVTGAKTALTEDEIRQILISLQKDVMDKQQAKMTEAGLKNKPESEAFLTENKKKDGIKTLASGLQYKVIKEGTGALPKASDTVIVHYRGTLINGTEFDSSFKRGQPAKFPVGGVIKGWTEALQLMKVGSKWQLFVPAELAYGERGAGSIIGPNAALIFEVELISIN